MALGLATAREVPPAASAGASGASINSRAYHTPLTSTRTTAGTRPRAQGVVGRHHTGPGHLRSSTRGTAIITIMAATAAMAGLTNNGQRIRAALRGAASVLLMITTLTVVVRVTTTITPTNTVTTTRLALPNRPAVRRQCAAGMRQACPGRPVVTLHGPARLPQHHTSLITRGTAAQARHRMRCTVVGRMVLSGMPPPAAAAAITSPRGLTAGAAQAGQQPCPRL